jgi:hypothetical protein
MNFSLSTFPAYLNSQLRLHPLWNHSIISFPRLKALAHLAEVGLAKRTLITFHVMISVFES